MKQFALNDAPALNRRFGETLRELRNQVGLTQAALAAAVGLERTSITNIEAGTQTVTIPTLVGLCNALRVTAADLVPIEVDNTVTALSDVKGKYASLARKILRTAINATR